MTEADARQLANRLYLMPKNQEHCAKWILTHINAADVERIYSRVKKVDMNTFKFHPERHKEILDWGRRQVAMLGYVPLEHSITT